MGPREFSVTVSAVSEGDAIVRQDVLPTIFEAEATRDYLVMSLATQLCADGHQVNGVTE